MIESLDLLANSLHVKCISIPPSPLLGGTLIAIAEALAESRQVELCVHLRDFELCQSHQLQNIMEMTTQIPGIRGVRASFSNVECFKWGDVTDHVHGEINRCIDSPDRLIEVNGVVPILGTLDFFPTKSIEALKKIGLQSNSKFITVNANLVKRGRLFSRKQKELSKGSEKIWRDAIQNYLSETKTQNEIVLVGDDSIYFKDFNHPRVINCPRAGLTLVEQLSLISRASAFIGMSSGVSTLALLGVNPYVIMKNPEHHKSAMNQQLGMKNAYQFARQNQFYLRQYPSTSSLSKLLISLDKLEK